MRWIAINTLRGLERRMWSVAFLAVVTVMSAVPMCTAQAIQKGISVELAFTSNAVPAPDADNEGSLIVTVTDGGSVYFGIDPVTPAALAGKIKDRLSPREQKLYVKADARVPYADVVKVLDAAHTAGVEALTLLTTQRESPEPGTVVPPKGLEVLVGSRPAGSVTVVQVLTSGQQWPALKVNDEQIPWATLQSTLKQLVQNRSEKVALVKADGQLPFAQVVHVIDMCRSTGVSVVLVTSKMWRAL